MQDQNEVQERLCFRVLKKNNCFLMFLDILTFQY
jgi:hypothetical protein